MEKSTRLDDAFAADRGTGSTPPESGAQSGNVVGRPAVETPSTAFHEPNETIADERDPLTPREATEEGGSYDGIDPVNP